MAPRRRTGRPGGGGLPFHALLPARGLPRSTTSSTRRSRSATPATTSTTGSAGRKEALPDVFPGGVEPSSICVSVYLPEAVGVLIHGKVRSGQPVRQRPRRVPRSHRDRLGRRNSLRIRWWWLGILVVSAFPTWFLHPRTALVVPFMVGFYALMMAGVPRRAHVVAEVALRRRPRGWPGVVFVRVGAGRGPVHRRASRPREPPLPRPALAAQPGAGLFSTLLLPAILSSAQPRAPSRAAEPGIPAAEAADVDGEAGGHRDRLRPPARPALLVLRARALGRHGMPGWGSSRCGFSRSSSSGSDGVLEGAGSPVPEPHPARRAGRGRRHTARVWRAVPFVVPAALVITVGLGAAVRALSRVVPPPATAAAAHRPLGILPLPHAGRFPPERSEVVSDYGSCEPRWGARQALHQGDPEIPRRPSGRRALGLASLGERR